MSGGGVKNNWRLGGGMDILIYFVYLFFNNPFFFCFFLFLFFCFLPCILVMVRYDLR